MAKSQIKDRLFRWLAVPLLVAVLAMLAVLQYHWSGQVSTATKAQMQSNLQVSLTGFRQDFTRELGAAGVEIRSAVERAAGVDAAQLKEQFQHWQQTAPHPNLVEHIYIWQDAGPQEPLRFDPVKGEVERSPWPAGFSNLREHLHEISAFAGLHQERRAARQGRDERFGGRTGARGRFRSQEARDARRLRALRTRVDFFVPWAVDQSIPALAYPVRQHGPPDQHSGARTITWLVIQLNRSVLEKEIFPELAQKYFRGAAGLDYHVAVRETSKDREQVLYASDPGFGEEDSQPMDASLNLFGPPVGRSGPDAGPEIFITQLRLPPGDRPSSPDERRSAGPERAPRFEVFAHPGGQGVWQVVAKHKSGSVEAAVSGLRRRNLMASFGVLVVLGVTMALIVIASQRARRLARLQMDFVAGVSHELRTPLAVISSAAENIAHGVVGDRQQLVRYGNTIVKQTRQLTQLVEQVLLFAATQQAPKSSAVSPVNVAGAVDAALEGTAATVAAAGCTVEKHIEESLPAASADFNGLVQSLQNLITNAVKYGGEKRWLRVSARAVQEKGLVREIALSVEDKGIGISKEELKQIFEPFYRSPAVAESGIHGTGLGLPLARTIVESMGGRITAESEPGRGSSFTIHLQVARERGLEEQQRAGTRPAGAEPTFSS